MDISIYINIFLQLHADSWSLIRARIYKPCKELRSRFPAWRASTTTLFEIPACQTTLRRLAESVPWKRLLGSFKFHEFGLWHLMRRVSEPWFTTTDYSSCQPKNPALVRPADVRVFIHGTPTKRPVSKGPVSKGPATKGPAWGGYPP